MMEDKVIKDNYDRLGHEICLAIRHGLFGASADVNESINEGLYRLAESIEELNSSLYAIAEAIEKQNQEEK